MAGSSKSHDERRVRLVSERAIGPGWHCLDRFGASRVRINMPANSKLQLRIASPCRAPWEAMDGDDRVRFCRECNRNVYNLSAMTETEARRIVEEREGRPCVRFFQRRDGTVLTSDCPVGRKRSFLLAGARTVAAVAGVAAGLTTLSACGSTGNDPVQMGEPLMGTPPINPDWDDAGTTHDDEPKHPDELIMGAIESLTERPLMGRIALPSGDE